MSLRVSRVTACVDVTACPSCHAVCLALQLWTSDAQGDEEPGDAGDN